MGGDGYMDRSMNGGGGICWSDRLFIFTQRRSSRINIVTNPTHTEISKICQQPLYTVCHQPIRFTGDVIVWLVYDHMAGQLSLESQ